MEQFWLIAAGGAISIAAAIATSLLQHRGERKRSERQHEHELNKLSLEQSHQVEKEVRQAYSRCYYHLTCLCNLLEKRQSEKIDIETAVIRRHREKALLWLSQLTILGTCDDKSLESHSTGFLKHPGHLGYAEGLQKEVIRIARADSRTRPVL